jgi:hypothetical protein
VTFPTAARHRRSARTGPVLAGLAGLVALWLGLTAPSVSPVPAPPPTVQTGTAADTDGAGAAPDAATPADGRPRGGRR